MIRREVTVNCVGGLDARPIAMLVQKASQFESNVYIEILDQKKESAFKLTYADEGYLYICVGYGKQESGGYSVTVNELYETDNAIYVNTNLLGPKAGSSPGTSPSYPYIVLKIEFRDKTVVFD